MKRVLVSAGKLSKYLQAKTIEGTPLKVSRKKEVKRVFEILKKGNNVKITYLPYIQGGIVGYSDFAGAAADWDEEDREPIYEVLQSEGIKIEEIENSPDSEFFRLLEEYEQAKAAAFEEIEQKEKIYSQPLEEDNALSSQKAPGGIDMNQIEVERKGPGIQINFDPAMMDEIMKVNGFRPVIMGITPIQSIYPLLGLASPEKKKKDKDPDRLSVYDRREMDKG